MAALSVETGSEDLVDSGRARSVPLVLVLLLGVAVRIGGLEVHSLWFDELHTVYLARSPDTLALLRGDRQPPLAALAFKAWIALAGESDRALRLLPAMLSSIALVAFALLAGLWQEQRARTASVALYAVAPFHVWHAQEVRAYALLELGAVTCLLGIALFLRGRHRIGAVTAGAGLWLALGSHYMGGMLLATAGVIGAVAWRSGRSSPRALALLWTSCALGALAWLPWILWAVPAQLEAVWGFPTAASMPSLLELPARQILVEVSALSPTWMPAGRALGVLASACFALGLLDLARRPSERKLWAAAAFFAPLFAALSSALLLPPQLVPKYLMAAAPGTALLMGAGIASIALRPARIALAVLVLAGSTGLTLVHKSGNLREDYRSACRELEERWRPGDLLLSITGTPEGYNQAGARHYLRHRSDILDSIVTFEDLGQLATGPAPGDRRLHVLYRTAPYAEAQMRHVAARHELLHESPSRYRIAYRLFRL